MREGYLPSSGWLEKLQRSGRVYIPTFVACKARGIQNDPWALGADDSDIEGKDYSRTEYTNLTTLVEFHYVKFKIFRDIQAPEYHWFPRIFSNIQSIRTR